MSDLNAEERQRRDAILSAQWGVDSPATREFNRARRRAFLHDIAAFFGGYRNHLLSFEELHRIATTGERVDLGVQEIPLEAVRGSVDRYRDFDLVFLPKHGGLRDRWERVAAARQHGLPMLPIEVYKLGDIYFVRDGHHRVSVCRNRGDKTIQAHVTELTSRVPLHPDLRPDDLPKVEAYADFMRITEANIHLPDVDLQLTYPRNYARLLRHIALFRYLNRAPDEEPREWPQAVHAWYEQLYAPILEIVAANEIMKHFPDRTPTDLYLWLATHFRQLHKHMPRPHELPEIEDNLQYYLAPFWNA